MSRFAFLRWISGLLLTTAVGQAAMAATISGPTSSTSGTFTLSWPSGYALRSANSSWQYASSPTTSYAFSDLPSGVYKFALWTCWQVYQDPVWLTECAKDAGSDLTVTVTRDSETAIDTSTTEAGTTLYTADVSTRGSAQIEVPLRTVPGINGLAPNLALRYDTNRQGDVDDRFTVDDSLGYGWYLDGASVIARCRVGLSGSPGPVLDGSDRLCLDGEPLVLVDGSYYWEIDSEYRTERQSFIRIFYRSWGLEVFYPDGRVARLGDTTDSKVVPAGYFGLANQSHFLSHAPYMWAVRQVTNGFGDTMTFAYDRFDPYGMLHLDSITYGAATVEFKYGPRSDLQTISFGSVYSPALIWRHAYLHTILVSMNGTAVREYRLDSNQIGGHMRLESIQECGYDIAGTSVSCLKPLVVGWSAVSGASSPISVTSFTDGLGAVTEYVYSTITTSSNPTSYSDAPFGNTMSVANTDKRAVAAVNQIKRSDGLTTDGRRVTTLSYKGFAWASTLNRGLLGFYEIRAKNEQSGVYSYTQTRLDFPLAGVVSQVRRFDAAFPSGTELSREEHAFAEVSQTGGVKYVHPLRSTEWIFEGGTVVGGSETEFAACFRALSGDTCPGSGTVLETVTQMASTTVVGNTISNPSFTPSEWGDVPNRTISNVALDTDRKVNFQNTTSPWVVGAPVKTIVTDTATGESALTVTNTFTYKSGTREFLTATRFPNDSDLELLVTRTFTGNNLTSQTISGADISTRSTTFGPTFTDDRYAETITNALSQSTDVEYDHRFGSPSAITDPDGNVTSIEYDPFGRTILITEQDGTETEFVYERCDVGPCTVVANAVAAYRVTRTVENNGTQTEPTRAMFWDVLGREVLNSFEDLTSGGRRQRTEYDNRGRIESITRRYFSTETTPTCSGASSDCTFFTYDVRDRVTREDRPDGGYTTTSYAGSAGTVTVTSTETVKATGFSNVTRTKQSQFNVLGQLTSTTDAYGTGNAVTTTYDYTSHGDVDTVVVDGVTVASMTYDLARNRTQIVEPNSGTTSFDVDALGLTRWTTDALGQTTRFTYDNLNRLTERLDRYGTGNAVTNSWVWDATYGTGQLSERTTSTGFTETYTYRSADSKLVSIETDMDIPSVYSKTFTTSIGYDSVGRFSTVTYPNGSTFTRAYNARSFPTVTKSGSTVLEEIEDIDAFGSASEVSYDNGLTTIRGYDPSTGRLTSIQTGTVSTPKSIQDLEYAWRSNSTLYTRKDRRSTTSTSDDLIDTFSYNNLEQLTAQTTTTGASRTLSFGYDDVGNLTTKTSNVAGDLDVTGYTYNVSGKPHRLAQVVIGGISNTLSYDSNGNITQYNATSGDDTFLAFDGQNNVTKITVGTSSGTSTPTARDEFWYDPDGQRFLRIQSWDESGTQKSASTVYLGNFEEVVPATGGSYDLIQRTEVTATVRHIRTRTTGGSYASRFEYVYRDHLGSVDLIADASGSQLHKPSHDPFGGRRHGNWLSDVPSMTGVLAWEDERFYRGFTDHEELNRTGFIHMNGRVYDPRIGRFVSPDPIVQFPRFGQSYNRYAYVFNSPLSFTDPSGFEAGGESGAGSLAGFGLLGGSRVSIGGGETGATNEDIERGVQGVLRDGLDSSIRDHPALVGQDHGADRGELEALPDVTLPEGIILEMFDDVIRRLSAAIERNDALADALEQLGRRKIAGGEKRLSRELVVGMVQRAPRPGQDPNAGLAVGDIAQALQIRSGEGNLREAERLRQESDRLRSARSAVARRRDEFLIRIVTRGISDE